MNWLRFSIARMMVVIVFVAISFAALRDPTDLRSKLVFNLALILLLVGGLNALFHAGSIRAFWTGYSMFGWVFLLQSLGLPHLSLLSDLKNYFYFPESSTSPMHIMPLSFSLTFDALASVLIASLGGMLGLFVFGRAHKVRASR